MPISINPIFPVIALQGAAPDVVLQPNTAIDAQVLRVLANGLVRIAIANLSIEVRSELPLQVGQTLQLAVSQAPEGIKLAVVGQGAADTLSTGEARAPTAVFSEVATPAPDPIVGAAAKQIAGTAALKSSLTPLEALVVSAAAQTAATRQGSLAPLFANLGAIMVSDEYPARLQQAAAQLLVLRPNLDQNLAGSDIKAAFESSGLFLESSLASQSTSSPSPAGVIDLKAALVVLRQTLVSLGLRAAPETAAAPAAVAQPQPAPVPQAISGLAAADAMPEPHIASAPAPSLTPEIDIEEILLPQARLPVADEVIASNETSRLFPAAGPRNVDGGARAAPMDTVLSLLQEALQVIPQKTRDLTQPTFRDDAVLNSLSSTLPNSLLDDVAVARITMPPPPFRGALPSAQPVLPPSLAPDAPLASAVHHLLDQTDAAMARQTLLQVASLPDRADISGPRIDPAAPRWNFEVPFATPAGTAVAQFEISRDGGANQIDAAKRVWRARFSLDVEPAGPVHALISLSGDRTSIRIWAERPTTATQLRAGALQLSQALGRAELQPGDIVIRDGAPTQLAPAPAGHFLDRAL